MIEFTLLSADWTLFIGRFHPVLVHFPIGFLILGLLLELGGRSGKIEVSQSSLGFIYLVSAIGSTLACIAGYVLSLTGGYEEELLSSHMWRGFGVAGFCWLLWAGKSELIRNKLKILPLFEFPLLIFLVFLVMSTGHLGGSLTHGEGYVFQYAPEPFRTWFGGDVEEVSTEIKPLADVNQAIVFADIVQPILNSRCVQCHGAKKSKGDLRLNNLDQLLKGGENGKVVIAGKGRESELVARALLPLSDDGHMPPKGKQQLTDEQIMLLTWWIDNGADGDKKVVDYPADEPVTKALAALGGGNVQGQSAENSNISFLDTFNPAPADPKSLENLRSLGLLVSSLAAENNALEVSAVNAPGFSDEDSKALVQIKDQLVWLKLGRTSITGEAIKQISQLNNLTKLNLEYNDIAGENIKGLSSLSNLEYLNLIGTRLDDDGLSQLGKIKSLRQLYIWQTQVTEDGIRALKMARPDLVVTGGMTEKEVSDFVNLGKSKEKTDK